MPPPVTNCIILPNKQQDQPHIAMLTLEKARDTYSWIALLAMDLKRIYHHAEVVGVTVVSTVMMLVFPVEV